MNNNIWYKTFINKKLAVDSHWPLGQKQYDWSTQKEEKSGSKGSDAKNLLLPQLTKLKTINSINKFNQIGYFYNNKTCFISANNGVEDYKSGVNIINYLYLDIYTQKLLNHFFSGKCKTSFISKAKFKHSATKLEVLLFSYNNESTSLSFPKGKANQGPLHTSKAAMLTLSDLLSKLYNKKVEIKIINLLYPQLNANIFAQYIAKFALVRKKKNFLSFYNKLFHKFRIFQVNKLALRAYWLNFYKTKTNLLLENNKNISLEKTYMHASNGAPKHWCTNVMKKNKNEFSDWSEGQKQIEQSASHTDRVNQRNDFLSYIPYQYISGIKVELRGRFSQRRSGSRTRAILRKKGSFKNLYSAYGGFHISPGMAGYMNANIQKGNVLSKSRNGSYNLRFTIASH